MPDTAEAYIHRIGRTGRAARSGDAFTMVASDDGLMVRTIERVLGTQLEQRRVEGFDYNVPAPERSAQPSRRPARSAQRSKPQGNKSKPASGTRKAAARRR
jgi:ATP-dependent RNA helicase RhlE